MDSGPKYFPAHDTEMNENQFQSALRAALSGSVQALESVLPVMRVKAEEQGFRTREAPTIVRYLCELAGVFRHSVAYRPLKLLTHIVFGFPEVDLLPKGKKTLLEIGSKNLGDLKTLQNCVEQLYAFEKDLTALWESKSWRVRAFCFYLFSWLMPESVDIRRPRSVAESQNSGLSRLMIHGTSLDINSSRWRVAEISIEESTDPKRLRKFILDNPSGFANVFWYRGDTFMIAIGILTRFRAVDEILSFLRSTADQLFSRDFIKRVLVLELVLSSKSVLMATNSAKALILDELRGIPEYWTTSSGLRILDSIDLVNRWADDHGLLRT